MILGVLCIIIGIIIILIFGDYKKIPNTRKTIGNKCVKKSVEEINEENKTSDFCIQYFVNGKEYYIKDNRKFKKNKKVIIKYNSENPSEAIVIHSFCCYLIPLFFIIFGVFAICYVAFSNNSNDNPSKEPDKQNNCCTCLDCLECDVCCDCKNPYLSK